MKHPFFRKKTAPAAATARRLAGSLWRLRPRHPHCTSNTVPGVCRPMGRQAIVVLGRPDLNERCVCNQFMPNICKKDTNKLCSNKCTQLCQQYFEMVQRSATHLLRTKSTLVCKSFTFCQFHGQWMINFTHFPYWKTASIAVSTAIYGLICLSYLSHICSS